MVVCAGYSFPLCDKNIRKNIWFGANIALISNMTFFILRTLMRVPMVYFSSWFSNVCLIAIYAITLTEAFLNKRDILNNSSLAAFIFFIFFPPAIFLLPFYVISIIHVSGYLKELKVVSGLALSAVLFIQDNISLFNSTAMVAQLVNVPLLFFYFFRNFTKALCLMGPALWLLRQQAQSNKAMYSYISRIFDFIEAMRANFDFVDLKSPIWSARNFFLASRKIMIVDMSNKVKDLVKKASKQNETSVSIAEKSKPTESSNVDPSSDSSSTSYEIVQEEGDVAVAKEHH